MRKPQILSNIHTLRFNSSCIGVYDRIFLNCDFIYSYTVSTRNYHCDLSIHIDKSRNCSYLKCCIINKKYDTPFIEPFVYKFNSSSFFKNRLHIDKYDKLSIFYKIDNKYITQYN